MTSELNNIGYTDGVNQPLYIKQVKVRIFAFMTGVNLLRNSNNGTVTADYQTRDCYMPRVKASLYKTEYDLSQTTTIKSFFTDSAPNMLQAIPNISPASSITLPSGTGKTFAEHGDGNTVDGVYLTYNDTDFGGSDFQWIDGGITTKFGWYHKQWAWYTWNIPDGVITNLDNLVIKIELTNPSTTQTTDFLSRCGVNPRANGGFQGAAMPGREQQFGYLLDAYHTSGNNFYAKFWPRQLDVEETENNTDSDSIHVNLDYIDPSEVEIDDETGQEQSLEGSGWALRVFSLATSSVNLFDEESPLEVSEQLLGDTDLILSGQLPVMDILVGQDLMNNTLIKKFNIYMKDNSEDTWYLQASVDTETLYAKSSTSGFSTAWSVVSVFFIF